MEFEISLIVDLVCLIKNRKSKIILESYSHRNPCLVFVVFVGYGLCHYRMNEVVDLGFRVIEDGFVFCKPVAVCGVTIELTEVQTDTA